MNSFRVLLAALALPVLGHAAAEQEPKFQEVYGVLRSNLVDVSEAELNRAAVLGLLQQLGNRVQLASTNSSAQAGASNGVTRTTVYGRNFGYIRIESAGESLASDVRRAWENLAASNRLRGAILDLRYAKGQNYQAAAETANLFVQNEQVLLKAGEQELKSTKGGTKIKTPVAVLVNRQTSGAPEALAAALREAGAALLIGSGTAGEARLFETVELSTGQKLRVGKVPVAVGGKAIPAAGIAPDIGVDVATLDERAYYQDPYVNIPRGFGASGGTNEVALASPRGRRFNEAELVRRHREGLDLNAAYSEEGGTESSRPVILDPALARAVDFLKGLIALRPASAD